MEQRYKKLSKYARDNGINYRTAWNYFNKGLINGAFKNEMGTILVPVIEKKLELTNNKAAVYARVSSNDRKQSLIEQLERLNNYSINSGYQVVHSVKEIGSGMNDNRKKLSKLLNQDDWNVLVVENKDRLTRFGFNYLKLLLEKQGKTIEVVNQADNDKQDLMSDLISVIYSFSARMYGLRRKKNKEEIVKFLES
jgi:putative resolvase